MDTTEPKTSNPQDIPKEINLAIERLVMLHVSALEAEFDYPRKAAEIKTKHYNLTISSASSKAVLTLALQKDAIETDGLKYAKGSDTPIWDFLGYLTDEPMSVDEIIRRPDFRKGATLRTNTDGSFVLPLKFGVPNHAIFLISFETNRIKMFDSESSFVIHAPVAPSLERLTELKASLTSLVNIEETEKKTGFGAELDEILSRRDEMHAALEKRALSEEESDNALEKLRMNSTDEIADLVERYKK